VDGDKTGEWNSSSLLIAGVEKDGMRFWNIVVTEYGVPIVKGCNQDKRRISFCVDSYKPRQSPSDP
jgi:hypothetical protein